MASLDWFSTVHRKRVLRLSHWYLQYHASCRKNISPDMWKQVFKFIQKLYYETQNADEETCQVNNIQKLITFVPFDKIPNIWVCFIFSIKHTSVFFDPAEPLTNNPDENTHQKHLIELFQGYTWRIKAHIEKYKNQKSQIIMMKTTHFVTKLSNIYRTSQTTLLVSTRMTTTNA